MGGLAGKPEGATWAQILGVAMLGGIGFTMSLFIGMLAFPDPAQAAPLRLGVLAGSLLSALVGYAVLAAVKWTPQAQPPPLSPSQRFAGPVMQQSHTAA